MSTVLVAMAAATLRQLVRQALTDMGHHVVATGKLDETLETLSLMEIDLMVVGEMSLRQWEGESMWRPSGPGGPGCPILYLLADEGSLGVVTLRDGRDRVLAPPYSFDLIHDAVNAMLRARGQTSMHRLRVGDMELDPERMKLLCNGDSASLTRTQYRLFQALAERQGQIVPFEELAEQVWGSDSAAVSPTALRSHIYNLRERLRTAIHRDPIRNIPHRGYSLQV